MGVLLWDSLFFLWDNPNLLTPVLPPPIIQTMTKRRDFLATAKGAKAHKPGFVLQARFRGDDDPALRIGYTCSKRVGNAVARNRAKRRLREIARLTLPAHGLAGWDYVLIGRASATADLPFEGLGSDLIAALAQLHKTAPAP